MTLLNPEQAARNLLAPAGITINGSAPGDMIVHNPNLYRRALLGGSLALGEAYMDGWWDANGLDVLFTKLFSVDTFRGEQTGTLPVILNSTLSHLINRQNVSRSVDSVQMHYDIGNDLYTRMLGRTMAYTCAYWKDATTLDEAQDAKFDLVCRKVGLKPGMKVLDLGCGWGGFAKYAAERYGVSVLGVTVSKEQVSYGNEQASGLPVDIKLMDYRHVTGTYDRVISIGLMEHVGYKNYREMMEIIHRSLKDDADALALVHTIGGNYSTDAIDPWINKYIFPNAMLPSIAQISKAMENLFVMEDWHNIGADYDKTLMAWHQNISSRWHELDQKKYDQRFRRMWDYYLLCCAGSFRARKNQLWQVVLSKKGVPGGYTTVR